MNAFTLKLIAIIAMAIDHIGAIFFPEHLWMRFIGRMTFPIMAYFIGEGFHYTRNFKRYLTTILIFAVLTEIPFDMGLFLEPFYWGYQNVLWTFAIALLSLQAYENAERKGAKWSIIPIIGGMLVADLIGCDYGSTGILVIFLFHFARSRSNSNQIIALTLGVWAGVMFLSMPSLSANWPSLGVLLPIPLLWSYNGERGVSRNNQVAKYLFYLFYPVHLAIIALIRAS